MNGPGSFRWRHGGRRPPPRRQEGSIGRRTAAFLTGACIVSACLAVSTPISPGRASAREDAQSGRSLQVKTEAGAKVSTGSPLVTLPWGDGPGQVGLSNPAEGLVQGPEALAISPDGRIAVLDSINHRVLLLSDKGKTTGEIHVELAGPRFLAVTDKAVYGLDADSDHRLLGWNWQGVETLSYDVAPTDEPVTALQASEGSVFIETAHRDVVQLPVQTNQQVQTDPPVETEQAAETRAAASISSRVAPSAKSVPGRPVDKREGKFARARFARGGVPTVIVPVDPDRPEAGQSTLDFLPDRPLEHLISLDGDGDGGLILGGRILGDQGDRSSGQASLLIMRLPSALTDTARTAAATTAQSSAKAQVILLRDSDFAYVGQPYVAGPDGRIYQPVATEQGYSILVHNFEKGGEQ